MAAGKESFLTRLGMEPPFRILIRALLRPEERMRFWLESIGATRTMSCTRCL
jgi:hypothetical protein